MSNIETSFLKKLLLTKDYTTVTDMQITDRYLTGRNRKAFQFIRKHITDYGKVPDRKTFDKKFPSFPFPDEIADESMRYFCDELRTKTKHNMIVEAMEDIEGDIEQLDPETAYTKLKKIVLQVENEVILSDRRMVNADTKKRRDAYEKRAKAGGMTGIPSYIDRYDYVTKGYNPGELTTILGYTGTGKSWFEIIQGVAQAKNGYKVLFFTTEMSTDMVQRRVDAVAAVLSYTRFRDGKLHSDEYQRFLEYLDEMEGNEDFQFVIEQATGGLSQISAKIDQYEPDIVYIDGAYLLADEESEDDDWRSLVRVWRGMHKLCLAKNLPFVVSTQSKEKKISLSAISFAKAISADCDVIVGLEQDEQMYEDREIKVTFHKMREGTLPGAIMMEWDFDKMKYGTIYMEGNDVLKEEQAKQALAAKQESRNDVKDAGKSRVIKKPTAPKPNTPPSGGVVRKPIIKKPSTGGNKPAGVQEIA